MSLRCAFRYPVALAAFAFLACGGGQVADTGGGTGGAAEPREVLLYDLERLRIAGERHIVPDDRELEEIWRRGRRTEGRVKLCVDERGVPSAIRVVWSSGFADYDHKLGSLMKHWRFKPFLVAGQPIPVCTMVTFRWRRCGRHLC
jgi:TonB family protein